MAEYDTTDFGTSVPPAPATPTAAPAAEPASSPYAAAVDQAQSYAAPQPSGQPMYGYPAPAPLMQLTGGMKFGWCAVGFLLGLTGILLAWLVNVDKAPQVKSDAIKFSVIGLVVQIGICILICLIFGGMLAMAAAGVASMAEYY
ncbi:spore coat protein SP96 [Xiamenia xianingshaonis]|uniref:Spore coat protein SP96 n=1 Tax=Xiamenia xianingshaonis TaxID=2682776 RepID=A0A9E6MR49_9ACTN|nr:spore coat protein SP96 [Xiamenia xianingshaonis]NHM13420.1 spore coat protein SP96 [Xiamenia xianingshaonis]QTU84500.1 spore coat protein SP96 [Xiamenia xianingshaonis]